MASTRNQPHKPPSPGWMKAGTPARLWLNFWTHEEPVVNRLKLINLKIHPFGLQFESDQALTIGTSLHLRLLLPPITAIALQGVVTHEEPLLPSKEKHLISIRFTTIRESDRKRLADFTNKPQVVRLRARCRKSKSALTSHTF